MVTRKQAAYLALLLLVCGIGKVSSAPAPSTRSQKATAAHPGPKRTDLTDDSLALSPARDLNLSIEGEHKAEALAHFVEGITGAFSCAGYFAHSHFRLGRNWQPVCDADLLTL